MDHLLKIKMKTKKQQTQKRFLKRNTKKISKENMENLKLSKEKSNKIFRLLAGFLLIPIMFSIYFIDRSIYSINPFVTHYRFKDWKQGTERIKASVVRIIGLIIIVLIITVFKLIMKFLFN